MGVDVMKKGRGRALAGPPSDRMMRPELVEVAECEACKVILPTNGVEEHYEKTGHETYNRKLVSKHEYKTRIGGLLP